MSGLTLRIVCAALVIVMAGPCLQASAGRPAAEAVEEVSVTYNLYFGDLHTHTGYSDAYDYDSTPWMAYEAAAAAGADFMAVTDHISIWNAYHHWVADEAQWLDTLEAADAWTSEEFVAMAGYEAWLLANCGEINVYNTRNLPPEQTLGNRFERLPEFYDWLAGETGAIGQFNHPLYVSEDFMEYDFLTASRDVNMCIIEAFNEDLYQDSYIKALDRGWHLMPSANSDTHYSDWISGHEMRTVLLAPSLTPTDLYSAMSACRGYATLDSNLEIRYALNGEVMGSVLSPTGSDYTASISICDPDGAGDGITRVEVVTDGNITVMSYDPATPVDQLTIELEFSSETATYFFLRVWTESPLNGAPGLTAWTAPVWTGR